MSDNDSLQCTLCAICMQETQGCQTGVTVNNVSMNNVFTSENCMGILFTEGIHSLVNNVWDTVPSPPFFSSFGIETQ